MSGAATSQIARFISDLQKQGGLKEIDIANFTDVSKETVSRWKNGRKTPHAKTQLLLSDLRYAIMRLAPYYTPEEIRVWLYARHPQLGGQRAIDLIHEDKSAEVVGILDRLEADAYL